MATSGGGVAPAPERRLLHFIRCMTLVERVGNAFGTLAFTWATIILLGAYATKIHYTDAPRGNGNSSLIGDLGAATIVFFLEATRMFSSTSNRVDYHLFFSTKEALKPLTWNGLVAIAFFSDVFMCVLIWSPYRLQLNVYLLVILVIWVACQILCPRLHVRNLLRRAVSLWGPVIVIIFLGPSVPYYFDSCRVVYYKPSPSTFTNSVPKWIAYLVLCVIVLLLTISRLRFPGIIKLADSAIGRKLAFWHKTIINLCMLAAMILLVVTSGCLMDMMMTLEICSLMIVLAANLQVPAAMIRILVAADGLQALNYIFHLDENSTEIKNLAISLGIFYVMVLGQGILYIVACIVQVFSFILRRFLVRGAGLRGQRGSEYVDLYYLYAFEKHMEGHIFSGKNTSIITFAMESLKSDKPNIQLQGVQMLDSFLKKEPFRNMTISTLKSSTETIAILLSKFEWTSEAEHRDIRSFAAKVLAELAVSLRVAPIPRAMQNIQSLLHTGVHQLRIKDYFLDIDGEEPKQEASAQPVDSEDHSSPLKFWKQMAIYCLIPVEEPSQLIDEQNTSWVLKFWKYITRWCSVPEEEPPMDHDFLPVLGMLILERLSYFDIENCTEISKAGLISMIIEFTSNRIVLQNINEEHHKLLKGSSLKVLTRLSSIEGMFGVQLRHKILENPFLLPNLAEILDENESCNQQLRELAAEILRNLAMDESRREAIGHFHAVTSRLVHAFLSRDAAPSVTDSDKSLQHIAGQALAILTMESPGNCLAISAEAGYALIKELTSMIHVDRHKYTAASLLQNICVHTQSMLSKADLKELLHILPQVLEGIMDVKGAKLKVLAGLGSQICNVMPEDFAQELERGQTKEMFIKRLVSSLNANMKPAAGCPGVTREIVNLAVCMMECNPSYTTCFKKYQMMEALLLVEQRDSGAENYRYFSEGVGLMEHSVPLSALVANAKEKMGGNNLYCRLDVAAGSK